MDARQEPTFRRCEDWEVTEGDHAADLSDAYSIPLHPWQRLVLADWCAVDDGGSWVHDTCLLMVNRQNGKTLCSDPRESWGLVRGESILHTAQEFQTAKKAFDRLRDKFGEKVNDRHAKFPELNRLVKKYTTASNQMILDLYNGGHIEFRTRGSNSDMGRGGTFDTCVHDEAQSLTDAQNASLSPLNSAPPTGCSQTIYMGTVPDPQQPHKGETFTRVRRSMREGSFPGTCIHEWGIEELGDVEDVSRWYEVNPSLGYQLTERALMRDLRNMSPETFAREHLGWWPEAETVAPVISDADWRRCKTSAKPEGVPCYAVKFSYDGSGVALAAAMRSAERPPHVEVVRVDGMGGGISWLADWLAERWRKSCGITIDGKSNVLELAEKLRERHVAAKYVSTPRSAEVSGACAAFANAVTECNVTHFGQESLNHAARTCTKRPIGKQGAWGFESKDAKDATVLEAAALAYWTATTSKIDPTRKSRVG